MPNSAIPSHCVGGGLLQTSPDTTKPWLIYEITTLELTTCKLAQLGDYLNKNDARFFNAKSSVAISYLFNKYWGLVLFIEMLYQVLKMC